MVMVYDQLRVERVELKSDRDERVQKLKENF
jgi:hypothetical protein